MSYTENYQKWLDFAELPAYLRDELVAMDEKTKEDAFYTNLEFGTAGMRGDDEQQMTIQVLDVGFQIHKI